jgi:hypothetical protein
MRSRTPFTVSSTKDLSQKDQERYFHKFTQSEIPLNSVYPESEMRITEDMIRPRDGVAAVAVKKSSFFEGEKVEGNYRGRGKWFPGKISRDRGDKTYDIVYEAVFLTEKNKTVIKKHGCTNDVRMAWENTLQDHHLTSLPNPNTHPTPSQNLEALQNILRDRQLLDLKKTLKELERDSLEIISEGSQGPAKKKFRGGFRRKFGGR